MDNASETKVTKQSLLIVNHSDKMCLYDERKLMGRSRYSKPVESPTPIQAISTSGNVHSPPAVHVIDTNNNNNENNDNNHNNYKSMQMLPVFNVQSVSQGPLQIIAIPLQPTSVIHHHHHYHHHYPANNQGNQYQQHPQQQYYQQPSIFNGLPPPPQRSYQRPTRRSGHQRQQVQQRPINNHGNDNSKNNTYLYARPYREPTPSLLPIATATKVSFPGDISNMHEFQFGTTKTVCRYCGIRGKHNYSTCSYKNKITLPTPIAVVDANTAIYTRVTTATDNTAMAIT